MFFLKMWLKCCLQHWSYPSTCQSNC